MSPSEFPADSENVVNDPSFGANPETPSDAHLHRWALAPIGVSLVAIGLVAAVVIAAWDPLGAWRWVLVVVAGLLMVGIALMRRETSAVERRLASDRRRLEDERTRHTADDARLKELQTEVLQQLDARTKRLSDRERSLADRIHAFHQLWEFPAPIEFAESDASGQSGESDADLSPTAVADLAEKDRRLDALLRDETRVLFERIRENRYAPGGKFDLVLAREDALSLVERAAAIYRPGVERPLLETSIDRTLRAVDRASLRLLSTLDELPVSVRDLSFHEIYHYVRQAVSAYRTYKQAEPYLPYANAAYYLGRLAMGASPFTLGAWWVVGTIGRESARVVAERFFNQKGLALLEDLVRTLGTEVATMYGGDYRRRDAHWIYGCELTELTIAFPASRDSLAQALQEIGALRLRSEYDRVFLTRCLASRKSADPQRWRAALVLPMAERRAIAERLERFFQRHAHGRTDAKVAAWRAGVEERLGAKLKVDHPTARPGDDGARHALRSLAGFLLGERRLEWSDAKPLLEQTRLLRTLGIDEQASLMEKLELEPPYLFEPPDLDPGDPLVDMFLDDLAKLTAAIGPHLESCAEPLQAAALYLRRPPEKALAALEKKLREKLRDRVARGAPCAELPLAAVRAALDLLGQGETLLFAYDRVALEPGELPTVERPETPKGSRDAMFLVGFRDRLVVFKTSEPPVAVWKTTEPVATSLTRRIMTRDCRVAGGERLDQPPSGPAGLVVAGPLLVSADAWFQPLLSWRPSASD